MAEQFELLMTLQPSLRPRIAIGILGVVWLAASLAASGAMPGAPQAKAPIKSTLSGVYLEEQAAKGQEDYMNICVGCHATGTYIGKVFAQMFDKRPVADLFEFLINKMPKDDPGSLSPKESAELIAYLLKINKVPAGTSALPEDPAALAKILVELPAK